MNIFESGHGDFGHSRPSAQTCITPGCSYPTRIRGEHCDSCLRVQRNARIRLRLERAGKVRQS